MAEKRKRTYHFHSEWEEELFFTSVKENCVCLICGVTVATTALLHTKATMLTTLREARYGQKKPVS